jgi:hypothetical protein
MASKQDSETPDISNLNLSNNSSKLESSRAKKPKAKEVSESWEDELESSSDEEETHAVNPEDSSNSNSKAVRAEENTPSAINEKENTTEGLPDISHLSDFYSKQATPLRGPLHDDKKRPETTTSVANRLISAGIGVRIPTSKEGRDFQRAQRENERKKREKEKAKKEEDEKAKQQIWDGD